MLKVRLLGPLALKSDGEVLALPASKKARALLAYLVATGRPHLRQSLCDLLWEGPGDPRGGLRWALSKIRPALDAGELKRVIADRERVAFEAEDAWIDLPAVRAGVAEGSETALLRALECWQGELLDGLELPDCHRFQQWLVGEREALRGERLRARATLLEMLWDRPEQALPHARQQVLEDHLSEAAHITVVRLLGKLGRRREALAQYERCSRILEEELGTRPSAELERARLELTGAPAPAAAAVPAPAPRAARPSPEIIGRTRERARLEATIRGEGEAALLLRGEPGIGKSRLLEEAAQIAEQTGGRALLGRAYEAERGRPYGPWMDALRDAAVDQAPTELAALLPEIGDGSAPDRERLFTAVTRFVAQGPPTLLLLDDLHWFDEASIALLHFVMRERPATSALRFVIATRDSDLQDNTPATALLRSLQRDGSLETLDVAPLDEADTKALVARVDASSHGAEIYARTGGNPLLSIEVARSKQSGASSVSTTIYELLSERLERLDEGALQLVPWAAALSQPIDTELLGRVSGLDALRLLPAVENLEHWGVVSARADGRYDFAHPLLRQAAYRRMSEPRRRLVHGHIAATLDAGGGPAGELLHHAALAGNDALTVRAAVAAGDSHLRVFANDDACAAARSGLDKLASIPVEQQPQMQMALLRVLVTATPQEQAAALESEVSRAVFEARDRGLHAEAQLGFYLLSMLHVDAGDFTGAHEATLSAARSGRRSDPETTARALANTGKCLGLLERDIDRAEALLLEARKLAEQVSLDHYEIPFGEGLVHFYDGRYADAVPLLEEAVRAAHARHETWPELQARVRLVRSELERGAATEALERCGPLRELASKMSGGSEPALAAALEALARLMDAPDTDWSQLDDALAELRALESNGLIAYLQGLSAELALSAGHAEAARTRAEEALRAAEEVERPSEALVARSVLAALDGDLAPIHNALALPPRAINARARRAAARALEQGDS